MSGRKSNLKQYNTIVNGDMSLASLTTPVTNIEFLDNIGVEIIFTGAPVGVFAIQASIDYNQDNQGNVLNPGHWVTIIAPTTSASSPIYIDLNQLSAPWIRVVYTRTSGTGVLNTWVCGKMI